MLPHTRYRTTLPVAYDHAATTPNQAAAALAEGLDLTLEPTGREAGGWPLYTFTGTGSAVWTLHERVSEDAPDPRAAQLELARNVTTLDR